MKKEYITPALEIIPIIGQQHLLSDSNDDTGDIVGGIGGDATKPAKSPSIRLDGKTWDNHLWHNVWDDYEIDKNLRISD